MHQNLLFKKIFFSLLMLQLSVNSIAQFTQQGPKLVGTGAIGPGQQGNSVAVSADGNTAIVGGGDDNGTIGAAWAYTRVGGVWTQQGAKLVGNGAVGNARQGYAVSISADGNTAIVGGYYDNTGIGAAWVFIRSGGVWTQQGPKLVGTGLVQGTTPFQGWSVSISADGNTAIIGGYNDDGGSGGADGASWIFTRSGGVWAEQGGKLAGISAIGQAQQGYSVSISSDGNTAIIGGFADNSFAGAAWIFTRSAGVWTQQGAKLVGTGAVGNARQGWSVSISPDGNTVIVGGNADNSNAGAAWVYSRSGNVWTQKGTKLVGTGPVGNAQQGYSVSLSSNGNTAIVGGRFDNGNIGAAWVYTRSGGVWLQQGTKLVGTGIGLGNGNIAAQGNSVAVSSDGNTAIVGGHTDNGAAGAAWVFTVLPTITSFTPTSGPIGTLVTITGTNLSSPTGFSIGGVSAIAVSNNGTTLVGMIMPGAVTGSVSVTNAGGTITTSTNFTVTPTPYPSTQQGAKLVGTGAVGAAYQGISVAVSADGNTAVVGGYVDNTNVGAAWIYTRSGTVWIQQGGKLVGTGAVGNARQGSAVSISADGNTAIVGGNNDNSGVGAVWIFTRSGSTWTQQGPKLIGTGAVGISTQGHSVAVSSDGNTVIVGGRFDNASAGAVWVYTRSGGVWAQQGAKLVGTGAVGAAQQGHSVSISSDGNTVIVGGYYDNSFAGAAWVYTRLDGVWTQQGTKLVGTGGIANTLQGSSVSLSSDGNTAIIGGQQDNTAQGAAWVFTRSVGVWAQQGAKLVGIGFVGNASQGASVSLSSDGNTAVVGGFQDNAGVGALWVYTRSNGAWVQQGAKLVGTSGIGTSYQGYSVALSSDGNTAIAGGIFDNTQTGAAWIFTSCTTPTAFAVSGGGPYCSGGAGVAVGLGNSQSGVNYQLQIGGVNTGSPMAGTGSAISFGNQTAAGNYTVIATSVTGGCTATMSGIATVFINPLPTATILSNNSPVCAGTTASFSITGTPNAAITFNTTASGGSNDIINLNAGCTGTVTVTNAVTDQTLNLVFIFTGVCNRTINVSSIVSVNAATISSGPLPANQVVGQYGTPTNLTVTATGTSLFYQWYSSGSTNNSGGANLGNADGAQTNTYTPPTTNYGTAYYYCVVTGSCGTISSTTAAVTVSKNTWTGNVSTQWDIPGNWLLNTVPLGYEDAVIPTGAPRYPVLTGLTQAGNLELQTGTTITIGDNTLVVGDIQGLGTITGSPLSRLSVSNTGFGFATLYFTAGAQVLKDLTLAGNLVSLGTPLTITGGTATSAAGTVSCNTPGAVLNSFGNLTLQSNQYGTASIAANSFSSNYINGDVTVERYIPNNGFRSWRLLSVPTYGTGQTIRQAWQEGNANPSPLQNNLADYGTQITGTGALPAAQSAGFDNVTASAALLSWNGAGWSGVSSTNNTIETNSGYFLYIRGERSKGVTGASTNSSATTLRTTGTLYQGDQPSINFGQYSFQLVGNVYPSAINFLSLERTGGVTNLFYVWDSKKISGSSLGAYQTFSATNNYNCILSGGSYTFGQPNTTIESGQAFFVQSNALPGTVTLKEFAKINSSNGSLGFRPSVRPATVESRLYNAADNNMLDAAVVVFDAAYSKEVNTEDAPKLGNPGANLGIETKSKILSVEGTAPVADKDVIQFRMWNLQQQVYLLEFVVTNVNAEGLSAVLEDAYLKTSTVINISSTTRSTFTIDGNAGSSAANRFRIVFSKTKILPTAENEFVLAPNPVQNEVVNLQFKNKPSGKYYVQVLSNKGQSITRASILHAGGADNYQLTLPATLAGGAYQVQIIGPDKIKTVQQLIVNKK